MNLSEPPRREGAYALDTFIDAKNWDETADCVMAWARQRASRYVCLCNVHSVVHARHHPEFARVLDRADLCVPDGAPIALRLRQQGYSKQPRISGPDLTVRLLQRASDEGISVFFYGGTAETIDTLERTLSSLFPKLHLAGMMSPPFRPLSPQELTGHIARINNSGAGILFVGLGCPKQEAWMNANGSRVRAVSIGVGAAFNFLSGRMRRAPQWMQDLGLEWFHRLITEPRRLTMRYVVTNSHFLYWIAKERILRRRSG